VIVETKKDVCGFWKKGGPSGERKKPSSEGKRTQEAVVPIAFRPEHQTEEEYLSGDYPRRKFSITTKNSHLKGRGKRSVLGGAIRSHREFSAGGGGNAPERICKKNSVDCRYAIRGTAPD